MAQITIRPHYRQLGVQRGERLGRPPPLLIRVQYVSNSISDTNEQRDTSVCLFRVCVLDLSLHSSDKAVTPPEVFKVRFYELCDRFKIFIISIPTVLKWATEFRQPCAINAVRQLFGCRVQQASSTRNFTLSCLPWMLSEDLKKTLSLTVRLIFQSDCAGRKSR